MKYIILLICLITCTNVIYGQEAIFNTDTNGSIIPRTKFIDPIENDEFTDITPYITIKSETILMNSIPYTIKGMKYKGWENELGDFNVIEILSNNKSIFSLKIDDGWEFLFKEIWSNMTTANLCYTEKLSNNTWGLFFEGSNEASQPPLLTIIVIQDGVAQLVHNHPYFVEKVEKINGITTMTLCENTVEWYNDNQPANEAIIRTMTIKDGNIYLK